MARIEIELKSSNKNKRSDHLKTTSTYYTTNTKKLRISSFTQTKGIKNRAPTKNSDKILLRCTWRWKVRLFVFM